MKKYAIALAGLVLAGLSLAGEKEYEELSEIVQVDPATGKSSASYKNGATPGIGSIGGNAISELSAAYVVAVVMPELGKRGELKQIKFITFDGQIHTLAPGGGTVSINTGEGPVEITIETYENAHYLILPDGFFAVPAGTKKYFLPSGNRTCPEAGTVSERIVLVIVKTNIQANPADVYVNPVVFRYERRNC